MKKILMMIPLVISFAYAGTNLSDPIDANEVPAELEQREEEVFNRPDEMDRNKVPATIEEREEEEKWRKDYEEEQLDVDDNSGD